MAKTFNPNRVGGGGVSIVRAADGTYSLKETGFDQISSLNMVDLSAVATTTTAAKTDTATDITGATIEDQTKQAFLLPKQDRGDDPFTTEKMLKSATDVSKGLSDSATQTMIANQEAQEQAAGVSGVNPFRNIDTGVGEFAGIKDPTEPVFGKGVATSTQAEQEAAALETPAKKTDRVTSAKVQAGLDEPPLKGLAEKAKDKAVGFFNKYIAGEKTKINTEKGSEVTQAGMPTDIERRQQNQLGSLGIGTPTDVERRQQRQLGMTDEERRQQFQLGSLGITADPAKTTVPFGTSVDNIQGFTDKKDFISVPAKTTFRQSINTALKGVGEAVSKLPTMQFLASLGAPKNESVSTRAFNKSRFNIVTSSGPMQGRIVGNDGVYDPQNNLFHGMNRTSALGNLEKAGQKRIDKIKENLAKGIYRNPEAQQAKVDKFERELDDYRRDKNDHNIKDYSKKKNAQDIKNLNPNEMRNVAETGNESGNTGGKSIVCTAMYQTTGLQDWSKAMKIWYIYQKKYLTIQHQEGYHKLFKPFVKGMHKSNIIKAIGAHFAKHRTQHLKHIMFNSKPSLLGKIYNKILEPICYWAGKK
jgi:hypothetical protein